MPAHGNAGWHIVTTPKEKVDSVRFKMLMDRAHDRVWGMAIHPPVARRAGAGVAGYGDIHAPGHMPLMADGSYITAPIPTEKLPVALALTLGILNKSIEVPAEGVGITAPLLSNPDLNTALDHFGLHAVLQQVKRSLPPTGAAER